MKRADGGVNECEADTALGCQSVWRDIDETCPFVVPASAFCEVTDK